MGRVEHADPGESAEREGQGGRRDFAMESRGRADERNDALTKINEIIF